VELAKRETILDAASRHFGRLGFKKASVDDIARDAGVAKGTVYLACESKADLFYQVVHRELRSWIAQLAKLIDPRRPADELLRQAAEAGIAYLEAHPLVRDLFFGIHHGLLPGWAARFEELRNLGKQALGEILQQGVRQGIFRPNLDVLVTAGILLELSLAGYQFQSLLGRPDRESVQRRVAAGLDLVLNGLRAHP
jgi:AcrR family transcriptional regulator